MKKHLGVTFLVLVFMAGLLWVSVPGASAQEKVITLNYANFFPAPSPHSVLAEQWGKEIEKRTNNRVKITFFHGGTLAPAAQIYDSTVQGIADMGFSVLAYTRGKFPLTEVMDLPLGLKNGVTATKLINAYYKKFQPKEFDEVKVLYLHAHGPGLIHTTKKPVAKLEDLKGMKLRATGLSAKIVSALGAAPVGTTMPETYDVLRTGVAEGALAPFMALKDFRWGELTSYSILNYGSSYSVGFFVVMNKNKWNALPPDIQKIFTQVNEEYVDKRWAPSGIKPTRTGLNLLKAKGVNDCPSPLRKMPGGPKAVRPLLDDYVAASKAKGLPGDQALKFCLDFIKAHQK